MFAELIYYGDKIGAARSHQATLHTVISELTSQIALKSKTLRDNHDILPSTFVLEFDFVAKSRRGSGSVVGCGPDALYHSPPCSLRFSFSFSLYPVGWHYQANHDFMHEMIEQNKTRQLSFHMNWNANAQLKQEFLEQMGDWYLRTACAGESTLQHMRSIVKEEVGTGGGGGDTTTTDRVRQACCSEKPLIRCHYRDKPSIIPCKDSPSYANGSKPFW